MTDFLTEFCELMKDIKLRQFKKKYVNDYSDIETILLYFYLYENISQEYKNRYNHDISDDLFKDITKYIFSNEQYRQRLIESFRGFQKENLRVDSSRTSPVFQLDM